MAKRRKGKRKGKIPAHLRPYLFKKKSKKRKGAKRMAKRKKSRAKRRAPARRTGRRRVGRRRGHRRGGGGGGYALMPGREDIKLFGAMGVIGFVEGKAKADDSFLLNKIPKFVDPIGFTGNLAIVAWVLSHFVKNPWLRLGARAAAGVTAYQLGRMGKTFSSGKEFFSISGWTDEDVSEAIQANMGALNAAGGDMMPGVGVYNDEMAQYGEYGGG